MMSSTNEEDPFLQVQQDVLSQLSSTRQLFTSYLRIRSLAGGSSPELKSALQDLESALESLGEDVADLSDAVSAAESSPDRFGLSEAEVRKRRRAVQEVRGEIDDMREEMAKGPGAGAGAGGKARAKAHAGGDDLPDPSQFALGDEGEDHDGGDDDHYAEFEQRQQLHMLREQDTHLDGVFQTVGNLRRQADDMGRELEEQSGMLDVVDEMADRVGGRLQMGMQKLQYVMRKNEDSLSSCCIAVLIFVLILLLILLIVL
ncbi:unnamed protein product [Parascedosporium putredinis]|uniref:t-SNARE affecting a late Golgi compartment protein 1 n=1 Tax=Parascedosporium putredinis TaxID=1442378 RepID=A0A9P1GUP2_9PEZI|nr:unnamed protein product [Parascedosporium putredinis]CAI7987443.1 unnamed protein product [Parascedosporium putredinis]